MINKNNTNIKRQRVWRLGNVEIAKKHKSKKKKKKKKRERDENKKKKQSDKKENFHFLFPYWARKREAVNLQLNGRCLKLKLEQVKIKYSITRKI